MRLAKNLDGRAGRRGRSPQQVEALTMMTAVAIRSGSAVLVVEAPGYPERPLFDVGLDALDILEDALEAAGAGASLPSDIDDWSQVSLAAFLDDLTGYDSIELIDRRGTSERRMEVSPSTALGSIRGLDAQYQEPVPQVLTGVLYALDLRNHSYRLEDDLGRSIAFEFPGDFEHLDEIRELVGGRIVARGEGRRAVDGRLGKLTVASVEPAEPVEQADFFAFDLQAAIAGTQPVRSVSDLKIDEFSEDEAWVFWRSITE